MLKLRATFLRQRRFDQCLDGRHLVFTQRNSGSTRLMLLDTVTKKVSALHKAGFGDASSASYVY